MGLNIKSGSSLKDIITQLVKSKESEKAQEADNKKIQSVVQMETPIDFENTFINDKESDSIHCDSLEEGLLTCLNNLGKVDIEYISKITGYTLQDVIKNLRGTILQNPNTWGEVFYKGFELKESYLVGNLRTKLAEAKEANQKYPGVFDANIEAIKDASKNQQLIEPDEIYFALGSPWIPTDVVEDFVKYLLNINSVIVKHDLMSGSWSINTFDCYWNNYRNRQKYGTNRMDAVHIISNTLNQASIAVYDKERSLSKKRIKNEKESMLALEKQKAIQSEFDNFVRNNKYISTKLISIYQNLYCQNYSRHFDGNLLKYQDMNPNISLFDFQRKAVERIIFSPNVLLAHDVGSGKTYEMIAAGHELKRMRQSKKNLYVVPNNIVGQWKDMYLEMYPNAKLLVVSPKNFKPCNRQDILFDIKYNDYEAIIMAYSSFDLISMSPDFYKKKLDKKLDDLNKSYFNGSTCTTAVSKNRTNFIQKKYHDELVKIGSRIEGTLYFDDLKIDRLFLDEAHNYKNVSLDTNIKALGIAVTGSKKCDDMMDKVHYIQSTHGGKGVVFATGTPITNSISDVFVIQRYLQSAELNMLNLSSFNSWISNFAEVETNFEIDVDTSSYRMARRFSKFHNLPELASLLSNIADFHYKTNSSDLPEFNGYIDVMVPRNKEFEKFLKDISVRADLVRKHKPRVIREKEDEEGNVMDNMLLITTDGRKAALDIRLVEPNCVFDRKSKVFECAQKVSDIYFKTESFKGVQLIFCDVSTPKESFNIYDELKDILIRLGVNADEIAFVHSANTETKRSSLFKKVNNGEIRILLGSTFKLGLGVNVQNKLYAIHHIDVPWRPSDMTQREGRIIRPGNTNKEVFIYRYITEQSFDAYSWQLLESKQNFISKLLSDSVYERNASDIDDAVLNYAEVKALAVGNPLIKERVELVNEIAKFKNLQAKGFEKRRMLFTTLQDVKKKFPLWEENIKKAEQDFKYIKTLNLDIKKEDSKSRKDVGALIYKGITSNMTNEAEIGEYKGFKLTTPQYQIVTNDEYYLYLNREGRYQIKVGKSATGIITRLNNFLASFEKYLNGLKESLAKNKDFYKSGMSDIKNITNYTEQIDNLQARLDVVDKKLGVEKEVK